MEVFEVARVVGSLFGVGDGRAIFRATADLLKEPRLPVPDQGGSRKVVALANTVRHLLKTLKIVHGGMHARIASTQRPSGEAKRGSQTVHSLVEIGRRMSQVNFVTFLLALDDGMHARVVPLANLSQRVDYGASEMDQQAHKCVEDIQVDMKSLSCLKR
jgi:hypothetical protein